MLELNDIRVHYSVKTGFWGKASLCRAVDGVNLELGKQETLGIVGESGCGKSSLGRALVGLTQVSGGSIRYMGKEQDPIKSLPFLRRHIQMIFQDPYGALNPRHSIKDVLAEPLHIYGIGRTEKDRNKLISDVADKVGIARDALKFYPHQFSGGQKQRIGIARALLLKPAVIIADEAVSALDVSIRGQIINLMKDIQKEFGISYLFISHDLSVVHHISDRMMVMYLGKSVEFGDARRIFDSPMHPYTLSLFQSILLPDPTKRKKIVPIRGDIPSPLARPSGCAFHPRCPFATDKCRREEPPLVRQADGRLAACHHIDKIASS